MQSSDRNVFSAPQSRADSAFHIPCTVSSTDTCELHLLGGDGRGLVRGAQEAPRTLLADDVGRLAIEEHRTAADEYGVVVAVDHAGQPAVLLDRVLGVVIQG